MSLYSIYDILKYILPKLDRPNIIIKKRKDDLTMSNRDDANKEMKQGKEESAATSVVNPSRGNTNGFGTLGKFLYNFMKSKMLLITLLFIVALIIGASLIYGSTYKKESTTYVEQVQKIATLATAKAHMKTIIKVEDNKVFGKNIPIDIPGTKRELFLIVPATITAGVDLKEITSKELQINEKKKTMKFTLPRAAVLQAPSIDMDNIQSLSEEGLFRREAKWDEGFELLADAQKQLENEAIESGLLATAEENAITALEGLFSNIGYTVTVQFK